MNAESEITRLRSAVELLASLARRTHYNCEDNWYGCPLSEDGCSDPVYAKDACNCGALRHNLQVDSILADVFGNDATAGREG